ncbi:hypothetical protein D5085_07190 [Ectothiorhodospiraceae bacterium BW-2]|nr:hypothetical protein D5085_07190 [Ectothiorhodospiraceae bacterium BW-2]
MGHAVVKKKSLSAEEHAVILLEHATAKEQWDYLQVEVPPMIRSRVLETAKLIQFSRSVRERIGLKKNRHF